MTRCNWLGRWSGVGGAIFAVIALSLIMDLFPRAIRARALTAYFLAVPLGAALALSFGAALAKVTTWQVAFLAAGAPGLLLALLRSGFPRPDSRIERRGRPRAAQAARKGRRQPRGLHGLDGQFLVHILAVRHHVLFVRARRA